MQGAAKSVVNIDMSSGAINRGVLNHMLNGYKTDHVSFLPHNIFSSFSGFSGPWQPCMNFRNSMNTGHLASVFQDQLTHASGNQVLKMKKMIMKINIK